MTGGVYNPEHMSRARERAVFVTWPGRSVLGRTIVSAILGYN